MIARFLCKFVDFIDFYDLFMTFNFVGFAKIDKQMIYLPNQKRKTYHECKNY